MSRRTRRDRRGQDDREVIPQRAEELTAEWFTQILATGATVAEVRCEEIGAGVGFLGEVHRCHLTWEPLVGGAAAAAALPASVIVKTPTQIPENFAVGDALRSYEREIAVYQKLRTTLGVPMPGYYHGAMDPDPAPWMQRPLFFLFDHLSVRGINWVIAQFLKLSGKSKRRYVLVIEDFADAHPPTQMLGGSLDDARRSLEVLARSSMPPTGCAPTRPSTTGTSSRSTPFHVSDKPATSATVTSSSNGSAPMLGDGMLERLDAIQERVPEICSLLAAEPWTLLHGDYRLDNVLFRPNGEIVVLDFQGLSSGRPAVDVAYFITTALTAEHRDEEECLLRSYHDALVAAGVSSYSFDELVRDGETRQGTSGASHRRERRCARHLGRC